MFLLFLPFHILLNLPSLLPSLPVPSIWQAAARKPGCIHNSSSKHQLIIHPAITHLPAYLPLILNTVTLFLFHLYTRSSCELQAMQSNLLLLYISAGLELCFDRRDDGAGVSVQLHVNGKAHSIAFPISRHGSRLWCQTASFLRLLIGIIYCPNRQNSCGFTA